MPIKREPQQAPLEQCLCTAVPTEPGPSGNVAPAPEPAQPPQPRQDSQLHPREEAVVGKKDPGNLAEEMEGGGFHYPEKGKGEPWASSNPQTFPTPSLTHFSPPRASRGGRAQTHAGSHLAPRSGFPNQTATGNFNEIQKGNCSYHCPTHTHLPSSPPQPLPPTMRSRRSLLQGSPYSNPIHSSHAACGRSRAKPSPGLGAGDTSTCWGRAGGAAPCPISHARPASALDLWLLMRMCRNEWAACDRHGDEEGVRGGGRAPRCASAASAPPEASLGCHRLDGEQAAELKVLDHRKLLQALQER